MPWVKVRSEVVAAHFEEKQPSLPQGLNTSKRASQEERPRPHGLEDTGRTVAYAT